MAAIAVTVLIPARNEEFDIAGCIDAVARQDVPLAAIQLIVVDAASDDATIAQARAVADHYDFGEVLVLDNPARGRSSGLNVGLRAARGAILARVDARSRIPPDYISTCRAMLEAHSEVGVVGGSQAARARSRSAVDVGIAAALRNRWATGMSRYRRGSTSGPSDTVWMGVFRTAELKSLGGWDEAFALNEDYELNLRYRQAGHTVWFDACLRSDYLPRASLPVLASQYFRFGRAKGTWWARGQHPSPRHVALVAAPVVFGAALVRAMGRLGPCSVLFVPVLLAGVERAGRVDRPDEPRSSMMASTAIAVLTGSWWVGVVAGFAGELAHVKHEHA